MKKEKYEKEKCEKGKYDALVLALFPAGQPPISKNCLLTSAKLFHQHHHDHNYGNGCDLDQSAKLFHQDHHDHNYGNG